MSPKWPYTWQRQLWEKSFVSGSHGLRGFIVVWSCAKAESALWQLTVCGGGSSGLLQHWVRFLHLLSFIDAPKPQPIQGASPLQLILSIYAIRHREPCVYLNSPLGDSR